MMQAYTAVMDSAAQPSKIIQIQAYFILSNWDTQEPLAPLKRKKDTILNNRNQKIE